MGNVHVAKMSGKRANRARQVVELIVTQVDLLQFRELDEERLADGFGAISIQAEMLQAREFSTD